MRIFDFHAHVGEGSRKSLSAQDLLRQMDAHGIERCGICPVEECISVHNRRGNDAVLRAVKEHPDRFAGFAVSNPWYGPKAVAELRRAFDAGLSGLKIHSVLQGFMLCDPLVDPLLEVAGCYKAPVYVHTGTMGNAMPFQLLELARRHPALAFVMGHAAYSDFWYDVFPVAEQAPNICIESSHAFPDLLQELVGQLGAERILFGSDVPESNFSLEVGRINLVTLTQTQKKAILEGNATRLLGRRP
jgi:hypothetical protein